MLSADGTTLLVSVAGLDNDKTGFRSAWWSVDVAGDARAARVTRAVEGDGAAAFLPDGSLLFTSSRPDPEGKKPEGKKPEGEKAELWCLPGLRWRGLRRRRTGPVASAT